jgi:tetratricopeptide (TPR) repeat protein
MRATAFIIYLSLIMLVNGTDYVQAEDISVTSNPEQADVFVKNTLTKEKVKIGKTPLKMSLNDIVNNFARSNVFIVEISKDGFDPYRLLLSRTGSNDIELSVNLDISKNIQMVKEVDFLMSQLFDVQRQIRAKDYGSALTKLDELEKDFPHYSIIYELKGSAYYLDKQFSKALNYYRKAFSVNPENRDSYIMKVYLEEKFELKPQEGNNG